VIDDCLAAIAEAARATGAGAFAFRGRTCDPLAAAERLTVAEAFRRYAGIDLLGTLVKSDGNRAALAVAARDRVRVADDDTWSDIFSKV
ncbi:hypothetical protein ACPTJN_30370, partial [Pseudomonas aeruginosa]|uniref:hypothetical protein n=1 Tax=Pseudomonas aeruginosa TaxID=287 RepID=UPI003CC69710